jgi:hypothetical protein
MPHPALHLRCRPSVSFVFAHLVSVSRVGIATGPVSLYLRPQESATVDTSLSERIAALVEAHRTGTAGDEWQRDMAVQFGGLGVYGDIGGALVLRPDGSVLSVGWDDEVASEPSPGWRVIALAAASYWYPELAALAPERPPTARPCWKCGGPGCESCFGMGWLPDSLG